MRRLIIVELSGEVVELRDIEIFLVLAEELHFGRTAERLHISQARVSQAIKKHERRLGAALFDRTTRTVTLTPVGRRLRDDLRQAYDLIQSGLARASAAGQGLRGTLRLGIMGVLGNELRPVIDKFLTDHPDCDVEIVEFHFSNPFTLLRAGRTDLQLMWLPVRETDITVGPVVLTEERVLAVPSHSDLAARESVSLEDLAGRTAPDPGPDAPAYWITAMLPEHTPSGRHISRGPAARTFHEILALVAAGAAVCPLNAHVTRYYTHPDITYVPIGDAPPADWALVWHTTRDNPSLRAFVETGRALGSRPMTRAAHTR
ncbi:LysR family transcriptional regulator [Nonomuraea sp. NPDC049400]|uniref:LysR family transcriptional regulator n=1 Tax=Nonomuraea sp. NPDC049400 TaxID=3364352 RepID=UPI0037AA0250